MPQCPLALASQTLVCAELSAARLVATQKLHPLPLICDGAFTKEASDGFFLLTGCDAHTVHIARHTRIHAVLRFVREHLARGSVAVFTTHKDARLLPTARNCSRACHNPRGHRKKYEPQPLPPRAAKMFGARIDLLVAG